MKVLVLGKGGREHALAQLLFESFDITHVYVWPGNDAMRNIATVLTAADYDELFSQIKQQSIDYCLVGSELYLADGIADRCLREQIPVFGPMAAAARLETSKVFAKEFMRRHHIPTADFTVTQTRQEAKQAITQYPVVLKYDGLAAGKGVAVCQTEADVDTFLDEVFNQKKFGELKPVLIEQCLSGRELSVICAVTGSPGSSGRYQIFPSARDYKRLQDNDRGPNTGGMGAVSSIFLEPQEIIDTIKAQIIEPTIAGLDAENLTYRGFLYIGLMLTAAGPRLLEYNCRFGDPEAQAVLPLCDGNFSRYAYFAAKGELRRDLISFRNGWSVSVVLASAGYPQSSKCDEEIFGLDAVRVCGIYHAGTEYRNNRYHAIGGRVLAVNGLGYHRQDAIDRVYAEIGKINFRGMHFRKDIGTYNFTEGANGSWKS